jgi:hypothetical protein
MWDTDDNHTCLAGSREGTMNIQKLSATPTPSSLAFKTGFGVHSFQKEKSKERCRAVPLPPSPTGQGPLLLVQTPIMLYCIHRKVCRSDPPFGFLVLVSLCAI